MHNLDGWADRVLQSVQGWSQAGVAKTLGAILQTAERLAEHLLAESRKPLDGPEGTPPQALLQERRITAMTKQLESLAKSAQSYAQIYQWAEVKDGDHHDDDLGVFGRLPSVLSVPEARQLQTWVDRLYQTPPGA